MTGDRIGKYVVVGEAGRGGMGIVYHARDESLDRDVAIKVLPETVVFNKNRMARFQREGKLLASLNHPNIAAIYEVGEDNDRPFVVLEYVEGQTLDELTRRGAIPWKNMLPIAIQIATAIEYAHEQGIIHRDLKPQNVKFDGNGNVKVLDFGLAKAIEEEEDSEDVPKPKKPSPDTATLVELSNPSHDMSSTTPGMMMGTVGYLSPEQACGREVDKQTDIFSFGCMLFEMLTGKAPFASDSAVDAIGRTLHKEPEWTELPAALPPRLKTLLRKCLAKEKKDRLHDIGDARLELAEIQENRNEEEAAIPKQSSSPVLMGVAAVAIIAAIAFAALYLLSRPAQTPVVQSAPAVLSNRAVVIPDDLMLGIFCSSNDDEYLRVIGSKEINPDRKGGPPTLEWRLYVRPRDSTELREIHLFTGMAGFDFSPDSESYALNYGGHVFRGRIDSTADPVELARIPNPQNAVGGFTMFPAKRGMIWFDDDTIIIETGAGENETEVVLLDAKTGDLKKTIPLKLDSNELRLDGLIGKFDDDHILMYVSLYNDEGFSINIATVSLTTGELKVLVERAGFAQAVGNHLFFSRGESLYMATYDPKTHELLDAGQPVMEGLYTGFGTHSSFNITDNGTLVYKPGGMQSEQRRLMINTGQGIEPSGLPNAPYDNALSVSGDGSRACATLLRADGMWEIWGATFDPPRVRKILAENDADYCYPLLSYDGTTLGCVQIATTAKGVELAYMVAPVDGSRPKKVVLSDINPADQIQITCFSLDNTRLMTDMPDPNGTNGQKHLVEIDVATGETTEFLSRNGGASNGLWSPDGAIVSFKTQETGVPELHVYNPKIGKTQAVSHIPVGTQRWVEHPDGSLSLIYWDNEWNVWESTIALDENGEFLIGEATRYPHIDSTTALVFALDNRGNVYTIEPGESDGTPNHLVIIENWLDSVLKNDN